MANDRPEVLIIQHSAAEPLGTIGSALATADVGTKTVRTDRGESVPVTADSIDGLVIMGGPMGVYDAPLFPFLTQELRLLDDALKRELPVLGICLGSQLLAAALGSRVFPSGVKEIGWYPVELAGAAAADRLFAGVPRTFDAFHWHGDTFDLPRGAVRLGSSQKTVEQGFRHGEKAWGLQFHLEVTREVISAMVEGADTELASAGVRSAEVLAGVERHGSALEHLASTVFSRWAAMLKT
jgi:GMP synthase-like glutamine amidotransferase